MGLIIGTESIGDLPSPADTVYCIKAAAVETATLNQIKVYGGSAGYVKVGLYSDNSGPDTLLTVNNAGVSSPGSTWYPVSVPGYGITNGVYYWLAFLTNDSNVVRFQSGSNNVEYWSNSYASGLPSSAPSTTPLTRLLSIVGYNVARGGLRMSIGM